MNLCTEGNTEKKAAELAGAWAQGPRHQTAVVWRRTAQQLSLPHVMKRVGMKMPQRKVTVMPGAGLASDYRCGFWSHTIEFQNLSTTSKLYARGQVNLSGPQFPGL